MARVCYYMQFGIWPSRVQFDGAHDRTHSVVAALHDDTWDAGEARDVVEQLSFVHKAIVDEIVRFDPSKPERRCRFEKRGYCSGIGPECRARAFITAPDPGGG